ncbi:MULTISPECIES: CsbD family protein [Sphingomonas]|uniref:CsbD family protein n=1 Tax=Sphingomonas kyungheensis TaxID=1069987 RepID=A0ABU8H4P5_9SPHN|nr:CsbD family protein [Sphingomonas sp. CV7422]
MNTHEWHGGARYVGGKVEKAVGDVADSREWQADGIVDQVAGAAENLYGRAQEKVGDVADAIPPLADKAREALTDAGHRAGEAAQHGRAVAARSLDDHPAVWAALAAAAAGYALGWLVHGRHG